jgi:hypothetical protein
MENLIELPEELKALLFLGATVLVTQGLKWLSDLIGKDLSGHGAELAAALVAGVLVAVNAVLSAVPAEFVPVANAVLQFVVVLLGAFGAYNKFVKK